jgi:cell division initiation protein
MAIETKNIAEKVFKVSAFRGYSVKEVDDYLDELSAEVDQLNAENRQLQAEVAAYKDKEQGIAELERTLRDTLLTAQRAAEDVLTASRENAAAIVKDGETHGKSIVEIAERQAEAAGQKLEAINRDIAGVKALIRRILGEQQRLLDESYPDVAPQGVASPPVGKPSAALEASALPDFDRTQEFSVHGVREQLEEEHDEPPL